MKTPETLVEALLSAAETDRGWCLVDRRGRGVDVSFAEMAARAEAVGANLQASGLCAGDRVGISVDRPGDFIQTFFGVQMVGGVPVPMCCPANLPPEEHTQLISHILTVSGARFYVTSTANLSRSGPITGVDGLRATLTSEALVEAGAKASLASVGSDDLALLQFTSGSTARPRGIRLDHRCVMANVLTSSQHATPLNDSDVIVSWLPLYHDLGLVVGVLGPVVNRLKVALTTPRAFIGDPSLWLRMISQHKGTVSWAPNHGYRYTASGVEADDMADLDLSQWRIAGCAGEPVRPRALARFAKRFGAVGFDKRSFVVAYGLAEFSLGATFTPVGRGIVSEAIDLGILGREGRASPASAGRTVLVTSCGRPLPGHELSIVDDAGKPLPERQVGNVWLRGPSRALGYEGGPEHQVAFADGWLVTGDQGYVAGGELFVCGRTKDQLDLAGGAMAAEELEGVILEEVEGSNGQGAAFTVSRAEGPDVVLVVEHERAHDIEGATEVALEIARLARRRAGDLISTVALVRPGVLPRTTSGKVKRHHSRHLYMAGRLNVVASCDVRAANDR